MMANGDWPNLDRNQDPANPEFCSGLLQTRQPLGDFGDFRIAHQVHDALHGRRLAVGTGATLDIGHLGREVPTESLYRTRACETGIDRFGGVPNSPLKVFLNGWFRFGGFEVPKQPGCLPLACGDRLYPPRATGVSW